jgi:hypothetical protein
MSGATRREFRASEDTQLNLFNEPKGEARTRGSGAGGVCAMRLQF